MDYSEVIKFAFSWFKDAKTWKYVGAMMGISLAVTILAVALEASLSITLGGPNTLALALTGNAEAQGILLIEFVAGAAALLISMYISVLILLRAMDLSGFKHEPISPGKFVRYIILLAANYLTAMLSLLHRKGLLVLITSVLLIIFGTIIAMVAAGDQMISLVSVILLGLGVFLLIPAMVFWAYNSVRLFASHLFFIQHNLGIAASIKSSWKLTQGRVMEIVIAHVLFFLVMLGIGIALAVIHLVIMVPVTLLAFTTPVVLTLAAGILNSIESPILGAVTMFLAVGIYIALFKEHGVEKPKPAAKAAPATAPMHPSASVARPSTMP